MERSRVHYKKGLDEVSMWEKRIEQRFNDIGERRKQKMMAKRKRSAIESCELPMEIGEAVDVLSACLQNGNDISSAEFNSFIEIYHFIGMGNTLDRIQEMKIVEIFIELYKTTKKISLQRLILCSCSSLAATNSCSSTISMTSLLLSQLEAQITPKVLKEPSIWILGNLAACCSSCRENILSCTSSQGSNSLRVICSVIRMPIPVNPITRMPQKEYSLQIHSTAAWTLSNLLIGFSKYEMLSDLFNDGLIDGIMLLVDPLLSIPLNNVNNMKLDEYKLSQKLEWATEAIQLSYNVAKNSIYASRILDIPIDIISNKNTVLKYDLLSNRSKIFIQICYRILKLSANVDPLQSLPAIRFLERNISHFECFSNFIIQSNEIVPLLIELLIPSYQNLCQSIIILLSNATSGSLENRIAVCKYIPIVFKFMNQATFKVQKECCFLIANLIVIQDIISFINLNVLQELLYLLSKDDNTICNVILFILQYICENYPSKKIILEKETDCINILENIYYNNKTLSNHAKTILSQISK